MFFRQKGNSIHHFTNSFRLLIAARKNFIYPLITISTSVDEKIAIFDLFNIFWRRFEAMHIRTWLD